MNNEPKSLWTKLVEQPYRFFLWLALATLVVLALCVVVELLSSGFELSPGMRAVAVFFFTGLVGAFLIGFFGFFLALIPPLKPLFRWIVRRSVFLAVCLVTLVALAYAVENWRGKRAWESFKREAATRGETMDVQSVIPPTVPEEQNIVAAPLFQPLCNEFDPEWRKLHTGPNGLTNEADRLKLDIGRMNDPWPENESANWMIGRRTDLKAWQEYYRNPGQTTEAHHRAFAEVAARYGLTPTTATATSNLPPAQVTPEFPIAPQPQTPAADVLLALSKYDAVLDELRTASMRPSARFPIRYEDGFNALLPHLARMKGISQFLRLRAAAELEAGLTNEAAADVELSLRLVDLVREEPLLISHLVRIAQLNVTLNSFWEGLADHRWTDVQLAGFDRRLGGFDFLADFQQALRGERVCCTAAIDYVRRMRSADFLEPPDGNQGGGSSETERCLQAMAFHLVPSGWFDRNKVSIGRLHLEVLLPAVNRETRQISPSNVSQLTSTLEQRLKDRTPYNWFGGLLLPAVANASGRFAQGQASTDLARVACALERHRLAHGQYPESLDALVPAFLTKLPHDVINGQPLKYRRNADGSFVLYSVGWNEKDDSGTVVLNKSKRTSDWKEGDWVWQYPVK
jgi:hypothetical protein